MKEHMDNYGWLNMLKEIAKTKVFDLTGMNSVDAVRQTKCFDVLIFASEEKMFNESQNLDYEREMKK